MMTAFNRTDRAGRFGMALRSSLTAAALFTTTQVWAFQNTVTNGTGSRQAAGSGGSPTAAPEINPALIVGAVTLVVGALLIIASRRRRAHASTGS